MYYYIIHLLLAFSWAIFLLTFIKSMQYDINESKIFAILSIISMIAILAIGTKMMLLDHSIIKSGKWIHVKLSFDILLMIENLFLVNLLRKQKQVSKKCGNIMYIFTYISFMLMIFLTLIRPF
jgi:putative membrane protein